MKEVDCDNGELYGAYKYDEMIRLRDNKNCGLELNNDQEEIVTRFSDMFKLDDLDILKQNVGNIYDQVYNQDKIPLLVSDKEDIPLVYKGTKDLFYFDPLTLKKYYEQNDPTMFLRRKIKDKDMNARPPIIKKNIKKTTEIQEDSSDKIYLYIVGIVVVIAIILLIYFMFFRR